MNLTSAPRVCPPPRTRLAGVLAMLALLALPLPGCQSMAPSYVAPGLGIDGAFADDAADSGVDAATMDWREYFNDARSRALVAQALANNQDVRIAALRVDEARAVYGIQRAYRYPEVDASAGATRSRTPADLSITGAPLLASVYQAGLGIATWEIDFWGRVRSLQDAALDSYLATDASRRAVTLSLITQVVAADLGLRALDERIEIAGRTLASRQETVRIFGRRVDVGSTSRLNLAEVRTLSAQAQSLSLQLQQSRAVQLHALTLLIGSSPAPAFAAAGPELGAGWPELRTGLPSSVLVKRPDVIAAEYALRAANANIGAARAAFFPRVALTAAFGSASSELNGLFAAGSQSWSVAPGVAIPLFDAGRLRDNLSVTEVRRDVAVAAYRQTVQRAFRDVADALSARRWLKQQTAVANDAVLILRERARLSRLRFDNGSAAFLEVLDAQRDLLGAEQQLAQTRYALLISRVSLYAALGGGSMSTPAAVAGDATRPFTIQDPR